MQPLEKKFKVAVDNSADFIEIVKAFNNNYKTDFTIRDVDFLDGVEFVFIEFDNAKLDDVFLLGYFSDGSFMPEKGK